MIHRRSRRYRSGSLFLMLLIRWRGDTLRMSRSPSPSTLLLLYSHPRLTLLFRLWTNSSKFRSFCLFLCFCDILCSFSNFLLNQSLTCLFGNSLSNLFRVYFSIFISSSFRFPFLFFFFFFFPFIFFHLFSFFIRFIKSRHLLIKAKP